MIATWIALGTVAAAGWNQGVRRTWKIDHGADARLDVQTDDGFTLALWRYAPLGERRSHPVVLCPGLGSNRYSFDLGPDAPSLARHLAARGFEVFVAELRGYGMSARGGPKRWGWAFDDYLRRDVPALLAKALQVAGAEQAHWVGHSMGGMLLLSHLARGGDGIRSGITVGSGLDYSQSESDYKRGLALKRVLGWVPAMPLGPMVRQLAPLSSRIDTPFERFNVWLPNLDRRIGRRLNAVTFHAVSSPVLAQLSTCFEPGGLRPLDGGEPYRAQLAGRDGLPPLMLLSGDRDRQCPPDAVDRTAEVIPGSRVVHMGPDHPTSYGHFDLLIGQRVEREVFPMLTDWLVEHD